MTTRNVLLVLVLGIFLIGACARPECKTKAGKKKKKTYSKTMMGG